MVRGKVIHDDTRTAHAISKVVCYPRLPGYSVAIVAIEMGKLLLAKNDVVKDMYGKMGCVGSFCSGLTTRSSWHESIVM